MDTLPERSLNGDSLDRQDVGVCPLTGESDIHRIVCGSELHHIDAFRRENCIEILHALPLLDHDRDNHVVERLDKCGGATFTHAPDATGHTHAVIAPSFPRSCPGICLCATTTDITTLLPVAMPRIIGGHPGITELQ